MLFGILLLFYVPNLDPYPGYVVLQSESLDNVEYEVLPGEDQICPERHANIFSSKESQTYDYNFEMASLFVIA